MGQVLPVRAAMCLERFKEWERAVSPQAAAQKRIIPQVPFAVTFSPAAQAGRRPAAVCCLPRAINDRGHGIHENRPGILF